MADYWKLCSMCGTGLGFSETYYACSVSTCNRKRTALYFCSLGCFQAHLPMMRHRDAWAEEQHAPSRQEWEQQQLAEASEAAAGSDGSPPEAVDPPESTATPQLRTEARRRIVGALERDEAPDAANPEGSDEDVLVVVSKLKKYIRARSGMNTSDNVVGVLSDHLRRLCVEAVRNAARDGRKTVMDRDFRPLL